MSGETLFGLTGNAFILAWFALFIAVFLRDGTRWRSALLRFGGRIVPIALLSFFVAGFLLVPPANIIVPIFRSLFAVAIRLHFSHIDGAGHQRVETPQLFPAPVIQ